MMGRLFEVKNRWSAKFNDSSIDQSDLDWILVEVLGITRSALNHDRTLTRKEIKKIDSLARLRMRGIPLSQVIGNAEFYGLVFCVNRYVLTPRPETELLVEEILKEQRMGCGLDIGTGSGAIAITIMKNSKVRMTAVDISTKALRVARKNNKNNGTDVKFQKSNLMTRVKGRFDFIVSNPPYIKSADIESLDKEVKEHEPRLALDGGESGYDYYEKIIEQAPNFLNDHGKLYFEIGIGQAEEIVRLLQKDFIDIKVIKDYNKIERIIKATKK